MQIIVGLGNPGKEFENTPHNIGFEAVDVFAKQNDFPEFTEDKKLFTLVSKKGKVVLAKPLTFMNESGKAVKKLSLLYKTKDVVCLHDDKDVILGSIKLVKNRGSAGHKGVESVAKAVGNKNLTRVKIGTGSKKPQDALKTVLKKFSKDQQALAKKSAKKAAEATLSIIEEGLDKAMNLYNR